jgi:hypothetical protein
MIPWNNNTPPLSNTIVIVTITLLTASNYNSSCYLSRHQSLMMTLLFFI